LKPIATAATAPAVPTERPDVSVVVATHARPRRVRALLDALAAQTIPATRFEVVVVDDRSSEETTALLADEQRLGRLRLRVVQRSPERGPARNREAGWRASSGAVVAFTDDDCAPHPEWLEAGLRAVRGNPGTIVQGRTEAMPWERDRLGPFSRTVEIARLDPNFQCCNVFYPRELLEQVDGFDTDDFERWGGEDADLAWRAIASGARAVFAANAIVYHAVNDLGPLGKLRVAARWHTAMLVYARHPELRRSHFARGIFWKGTHYHLVRTLAALVLPRQLRFLRPWLAGPYVLALRDRAHADRASLLLIPYYMILDLVELWSVVRAAVRYRAPML
jgi:glycosyltransferase involved in cell wall biosynthesis